ncbi:MAG TPA: SRPBCC family protein [Acidobacteriaceae bacterium]|nr:SRPBCC family protein [Acidobacteriaceae bacterium]
MLKTVVLVLVAAAIGILIFAAMKPATYHVERSMTIAATPEKISPLLDDFHNWDQWSPWAKLDPNMRVTYSGSPAGQGAVYEWEGNSKVGKGRMEIVAVQPTLTSIKLDFFSPFASHNQTNFFLQPQGPTTRVTWTMDGPNTFASKLMSVFVSMDKMIGKDFDAGLNQLKSAAERQS